MSSVGVETTTVECFPRLLLFCCFNFGLSLSLSHWADKRGTDLLQKVKANVYDNLGKLSRLEVDFRNGKVLLVTSFGSPDRLSPGLLSEVQNRDQKLASVRWQ